MRCQTVAVELCPEGDGSAWLLTLALAGLASAILFSGMWWDARKVPLTKPKKKRTKKSDGFDDDERIAEKWLTVYLFMLLGLPVVFLVVSRSAGSFLAGLFPIGFVLVLALGFASAHRRTARAARWTLLALWTGGLAVALGASASLLQLGSAC